MGLGDLSRDELIGEDFFEHVRANLEVIILLSIGIFTVFTWNTYSFELGVGMFNTPLMKGGLLLICLTIALELDLKNEINDER